MQSVIHGERVSPHDPILLEIEQGRIQWRNLRDGHPRVYEVDPNIPEDELREAANDVRRTAYRSAKAVGMHAATAFNRDVGGKRLISIQFYVEPEDDGPLLVSTDAVKKKLESARRTATRRKLKELMDSGEIVPIGRYDRPTTEEP